MRLRAATVTRIEGVVHGSFHDEFALIGSSKETARNWTSISNVDVAMARGTIARVNPWVMLATLSIVLAWTQRSASCQSITRRDRDTARQQIDQFMHTISDRGQFSGAVLVGDPDGILYEAAFGQANRAQAKVFTTQTQSCLASVSKPFTALLVMMQVENGSMGLDDAVSKYVSGLKKPVADVTIRQLLSHTSGVPDYGNTPVDHPGATTEEVLDTLRTIDHLAFPPGERYEYSNSGYVLLGAAVAASAKTPFPELLERRILGPAGMKSTFVLTGKGQKTSETAT